MLEGNVLLSCARHPGFQPGRSAARGGFQAPGQVPWFSRRRTSRGSVLSSSGAEPGGSWMSGLSHRSTTGSPASTGRREGGLWASDSAGSGVRTSGGSRPQAVPTTPRLRQKRALSQLPRRKQGATSADSGTWEDGGFMGPLSIPEGDGVGNPGPGDVGNSPLGLDLEFPLQSRGVWELRIELGGRVTAWQRVGSSTSVWTWSVSGGRWPSQPRQ